MDLDEPIPSQESATSSPSSPANNPPELARTSRVKHVEEEYDPDQCSARKRQRMDSDAPQSLTSKQYALLPHNASSSSPTSENLPATPTQNGDAPLAAPETTSNKKVTLNLRNTREIEQPASPSSSSPPTLPPHTSESTAMDQSAEDAVNAHEIHKTIETPSSSLSSSEEPEVMAVESESEYLSDAQPTIEIIDDDVRSDDDPTFYFPYLEDTESLQDSAYRLANHFEHGSLNGAEQILRLQTWMNRYVAWATRHIGDAFTSYCENKDFWDAVVDVMKAFSFRKNHYGNWLKTDNDARNAMSSLLGAYAMLSGFFVAMDLHTLTRHVRNPQSRICLASRNFLDTLHFLLAQPQVDNSEHLGSLLTQFYAWDWGSETQRMHSLFERQGASTQLFFETAKLHIDLGLQQPKLLEELRNDCRFVDLSLRFAHVDVDTQSQQYQDRLALANEFFNLMDDHIHTFIEKHATLLHADALLSEIVSLSGILELLLQPRNGHVDRRLQEARDLYPEIPPRMLPRVLAWRWKLSVLNKLMHSPQMQLRVGGAAGFSHELVSMWTQSRNSWPAEEREPFLANLAAYIVSTNLVDYIVGVASHPEIILHSKDILGFIAVTGAYEDYHSDIIWSSIKSSQDPRVVESVLSIMRETLHLFNRRAHLYFCAKLLEIPAQCFRNAMRLFCQELFKQLLVGPLRPQMELEAPPYDVCVRVICESSAPRGASPASNNDVQQWASEQFMSLTKRDGQYIAGPDAPSRLAIYNRCLDDLRAGKNIDGCLIVLNILIEANPFDLHDLIAEADFMQLLIDNFSYRASPYCITKHLRLFQRLIEVDHITDTSMFGLQLWNKIIGADEADHDRKSGWTMLCAVMLDMRACKREYPFMKACIQQYLPSLPPHLFTNDAFTFACKSVGLIKPDAEGISGSLDEVPPIDENGIEQLWRMVLDSRTSPGFQQYSIGCLIHFYLNDFPTSNELPPSKILGIHLGFVDRCMAQLTSAAARLKSFSEGTTSGDDEPMVIIAPDDEVRAQESLFSKSLILLRSFVSQYQASPKFAQKLVQQPQIASPPESLIGEPMEISYQVCDSKAHSVVQTLKIGRLNTGMSLFGSLQKAAGFQPIRVHHCGKEVTAAEFDLSKSLDELKLGTHLVLVSPKPSPGPGGERSPVQMRVMEHTEDLFKLLSMENHQAKDIYEILSAFPAYNKFYQAFAGSELSCEELFPAQHPYKCLYTMCALQSFIAEQYQSRTPDADMPPRCFNLLVETLLSHEYLCTHTDEDFKPFFFTSLLDSTHIYVGNPTLADIVGPSMDCQLLVDRLILLLSDALKSSSRFANLLICKTFWAICRFSIWSPGFWEKLKAHPDTVQMVESTLLRKFDSIPGAQASNLSDPLHTICTFCSHPPGVANPAPFMEYFWPLLVGLVPKVRRHHSDQVLMMIRQVLHNISEISIAKGFVVEGFELGAHAKEWGRLLLNHKVFQSVGRPADSDHVALGIATLLRRCTESTPEAELQSLRPMAIEFFNVLLFPSSLSPGSIVHLEDPLPMLDTITRSVVVETITIITKDDVPSYVQLMKLATNLVPYLNDEDDYTIELTPSFERSRVMRSSTGYVGLKNLSNTCYLNSLMTQFFMNLKFRQFMFESDVGANNPSQNLLKETQTLFASMQNSFHRFADTHNFAQSIQTYEDGNIDVTVQMDVDEFYNLLFDRWESQIVGPDAKAAFRSFYGGQLVQQVKSKECDHISERLEPFSAIQCDIKGKASLKESLQAYVDGEIMEGDNKYKCSTCDQHVDAVKRACLKDVPDNLIFHLKRFDYNLREGRRSKLNDYFSFPDEIDMRPYKVEYLTQGPEGCEEDIFELVGVLVHSGTAESGHYYSYIRERPTSGNSRSWVEFNDDQVSAFDPSNIEANCFGGPSYQSNTDFQFDKNYSAYMLFYQRRSSLIQQQQESSLLLNHEPIKLPLPTTDMGIELAKWIAEENQRLLRKYVLYDPSHAALIRHLFYKVSRIGGGSCTEDHQIENSALQMSLNYMDQVLGRTKDIPDFEFFVVTLRYMVSNCCVCAQHFLRWMAATPSACRYYLVKCPETFVRAGVCALITVALKTLKAKAPDAYGLTEDHVRQIFTGPRASQSESQLTALNKSQGSFGGIVEVVRTHWDLVLVNLRAWPEFFGLVTSMVDGVPEAALLMDNGLCRKTIEIAMASQMRNEEPPEIVRMNNVIARKPANRIVHWDVIASLLAKFFQSMTSISVADPHPRPRNSRLLGVMQGSPLTVSPMEYENIGTYWISNNDNIIVSNLLRLNVNETASQSLLEQLLTKYHEEEGSPPIKLQIFHSIARWVQRNHPSVSPRLGLRMALTFCRFVDEEGMLMKMISAVRQRIVHSDVNGGHHFLEFFKDLMELPAVRANMTGTIQELCMSELPHWAPGLLVNFDQECRALTEDYLNEAIIKPWSSPIDYEDPSFVEERKEVARQLGAGCLDYLDRCFIRQDTQVLKNFTTFIHGISAECQKAFEDGTEEHALYKEKYERIWDEMKRLSVNQMDEDGDIGSEDWDQSDATDDSFPVDDEPISLIDNNEL